MSDAGLGSGSIWFDFEVLIFSLDSIRVSWIPSTTRTDTQYCSAGLVFMLKAMPLMFKLGL